MRIKDIEKKEHEIFNNVDMALNKEREAGMDGDSVNSLRTQLLQEQGIDELYEAYHKASKRRGVIITLCSIAVFTFLCSLIYGYIMGIIPERVIFSVIMIIAVISVSVAMFIRMISVDAHRF